MFISFILLAGLATMDAQVTGLWKSTDHIDDTERSIVNIYEINGKIYGKIEKLVRRRHHHAIRTGCDGELKNRSSSE